MEINRLHRKSLDAAVINSLMLRFRPIAPKPTSGEPCHAAIDSIVKPRLKRKYLGCRRTNGGRGGKRRTKFTKPDGDRVVEAETLRLKVSVVPAKAEEPPSKVTKAGEGLVGADSCSPMKRWREDVTALPRSRIIPRASLLPDLNAVGSPSPRRAPTVETMGFQRKKVLETWLIVESIVADARCIHRVGMQQQQVGLTITDEERVRCLAEDTCPGFVTDVDNLIRWVNGSCERMVRKRLAIAGRGGEAAVWMVAKEDLPNSYSAFTCRVRILYVWQDEGCPMWWEGPRSVTVAPCDAWKLESGGFAWRLDVEAALTLGR